jgi:hypothetical protein
MLRDYIIEKLIQHELRMAEYINKKYFNKGDSMRHPQADLLIYAAENKDALFDCHDFKGKDIEWVIRSPEYGWHIKPKTVTKYLWAFKCSAEHGWGITATYYSEEEYKAKGHIYDYHKLEFTAKEFPL